MIQHHIVTVMKKHIVFLHCLLAVAAANVIGSRQFQRYDDTDRTSVSSIKRKLQQSNPGDFDRFNELFQGATIAISDDFEVSVRVALITLTLWVDNIDCYDVSVGNILMDHTKTNNDIDVTVNISEFDLKCDIQYRYKYGLLSGDGVAQVFTDNNSAATTLRFSSDDYESLPPSTSSVQECVTNINIVRMMFHGDTASDIVEWFEKWIRNLVEQEIEAVACSELGSLGTTFVQDMLQIADNTLQGYQTANASPHLFNPLYLEEKADLPVDLVPLNLQDFDSIAGGLVDQVLQTVDELLGSIVSDPGGPNDSDLGINIFLRSNLLDKHRALIIDVAKLGMDAVIFKGHDKLTESTITINQVKILGLDSLVRFNPLIPIGVHTLQNELTWDYLTLEFDITVDIKPSTLDDAVLKDATSSGISERILVDFEVRNVDLEASLYIVIDQEALGGMTLGSLLFVDNILPCFMSIIHHVELSGLSVDPHHIDLPTVSGFVSPGLDRIITSALEAAFDMYSGALAKTIPNIFQVTVRDFVNTQVISTFLNDKKAGCPEESIGVEGYVDFRDLRLSSGVYGSLPSMLLNLLDTELLQLDPVSKEPKINAALIAPMTTKQSGKEGTLVFDGNLVETGTKVSVGGLNADIQLKVYDVKIENLDTVSLPLSLLNSVADGPHYLNNTATIGHQERPLHFSTRFLFAIAGDEESEIKNELDISLDIEAANIILMAMLKVANARLLGFPLSDVLDMNCWLATIPAPALDSRGIRLPDSEATAAVKDIVATVSKVNLNISCVECSSPGVFDLAKLLTTKEAQVGATEVANILLDAATGFLGGNFMQVQIDRLLVDAGRKCPHSPDYDPSESSVQYESLETPQNEADFSSLMLLGGVTFGVIALVAFLVLAIKFIVWRRHKWWLSQISEEQLRSIERQQTKEQDMETQLNSISYSMFQSSDIPTLVRWSMPLVLLGNIGLFLSGHLSLGATVNIEASIAGQTIQVEEFFEFSMAKSTIDIWNAGGKELAVLILIFSGIWPYTKQLITLGLWFVPSTWVSISRRGSILLWLDWLAKWSMIDIFVLVISIAAFRVTIKSPDVAFLPEGFYSIDLLVVPLWGLYANLLAQLVSQISSHVIIHYQRRIYNNARDAFKEEHQLESAGSRDLKRTSSLVSQTSFEGKKVLRKHQFGRPHRGEDEKLIVSSQASYAIIALGLCLTAFVVMGCILPSFSLDILGLIGVAVESGQEFEDAITYHSVFTVVQLLMEEAHFLDTPSDVVGLGTLCALFVLTVLVIPVLQSGALVRQWFCPLSLAERSQMSNVTEVLQAWQYTEVYLIAIFVASWQLGPVSEFMINSYCKSLDGFFAQMVYFGLLKVEDAQCFSVKSSIEGGAYILAAGAVCLALLNTIVSKAVTQYLYEKAQLEKRIDDEMSSQQANSLEEAPQNEVVKQSHFDRIHPVPVLFSDTFRWLLHGGTQQNLSKRLPKEQQLDVRIPEGQEVINNNKDAIHSVPSSLTAASRGDSDL